MTDGHRLDLKPDALCARFDSTRFPFESTGEIAAGDRDGETGLVGQDRALKAIRLAAKMSGADFNLFALGPPGCGRHAAVRASFTAEARAKRPPSDWVYVNNFDDPRKPRALELPSGTAMRLKAAMEALIDDLATALPAMFESDAYQSRYRAIDQEYDAANETSFGTLVKDARAQDVMIMRTPMGFAVAAMKDGKAIPPEEFEALDPVGKAAIEVKMTAIRLRLEEVLKEAPKRERERRKALESLNAEMAKDVVDAEIGDVLDDLGRHKPVYTYIEAVRADIIDNTELFLMQKDNDSPFPETDVKHHAKPRFHRYTVNPMVARDPKDEPGAPVVAEDLPNVANLIGRIEHISAMGALITDFTMIKPGALHRANGGYLVLDARQVLTQPLAWDALKRCLKSDCITIVSPEQMVGLASTMTLEPEPIPLDVRVALVGERMLYYLLVAADPEFAPLFKVQADFSDEVVLTDGTVALYTRFIAGIARRENVRPISADGVARILVEGTRIADDTERLSLAAGRLADIIREADFVAGEAGLGAIESAQIDRAIEAAEERASRVRELSHEAITRDILLIDTDGTQVGQINALSVMQLGEHRFGRPSRVTARARLGAGKVVDIERETELGGPIHSKGVLILSGYLATHYATDVPMSLWASIVFEQSYGGVDGDSASAAELFALLSALAGVPLSQSFAVTGSINQLGQIQAIGGVNEKIEGFFDICATRGLTGRQGVLIPKANIKSLALRHRVVDAVTAGHFRIAAIETVAEGLEILTGITAGERDAAGLYPQGSVNRRVEDRLVDFAKRRKAFAAWRENGDRENTA